MFGWFKKRNDIYSPKERKIFSYFDGKRTVQADPLALYKRVMDKGPSLSIDIAVSQSQSKDAAKAQKELVENIRKIFNIEFLTNEIECEGTLTDVEVLNLLDMFMDYTADVKKNSKTSLIMPTTTLPSSTSKDDQATINTSDSGSTKTEHSISEPVA